MRTAGTLDTYVQCTDHSVHELEVLHIYSTVEYVLLVLLPVLVPQYTVILTFFVYVIMVLLCSTTTTGTSTVPPVGRLLLSYEYCRYRTYFHSPYPFAWPLTADPLKLTDVFRGIHASISKPETHSSYSRRNQRQGYLHDEETIYTLVHQSMEENLASDCIDINMFSIGVVDSESNLWKSSPSKTTFCLSGFHEFQPT